MAVHQMVMNNFLVIINHSFLYCLKAYQKRVTSAKNMFQIMTGNLFITFWFWAILAKNHRLRPKWLFIRWLWTNFQSLSTTHFLYCLKAYLKRVTSPKNMFQIMTGNFFITFWFKAILAKKHPLRPKWLFIRW